MQLRNFAAVQNYEHSVRRRPINQLESLVVFWNYDPARLQELPHDAIDMHHDAELADVQDLVD